MAERTTLSKKDWDSLSEFIKEEKENRANRRKGKEQIWAEIDRQLEMAPRAVSFQSGDKKDWYPELETPLQFNALEVVAADARRMKFPKNQDWYTVTTNLSEEYSKRFAERRKTKPLISKEKIALLGEDTVILDQETADVLVKSVMDHYHRLYNFRGNMDLVDIEAIKYGTGIPRVREVSLANFAHDIRGVRSSSTIGPAVIPCSVWNTYLDDSPSVLAHEGITTSPSTVRSTFQRLDDLNRAAKVGGADRGWISAGLKDLEALDSADGHKGQIELLEFEGDVFIAKSKDDLFLPNSLVTIAVGKNTAAVVRYRENPQSFHSYVPFYYMRQDINDAYGVSPLMKGQPLQEAVTQALNDTMASGLMNARPHVVYDRNDPQLVADGGLDIKPGGQSASDNPQGVIPLPIGNPAALLNSLLALKQLYEELTGVNDARRGERLKSHTTAGAAGIEATQGLSRTDDFVADQIWGALPTILDLEYRIIKKVMKNPVPVSVDKGGIDGWINVAGPDLADELVFFVQGAAGIAEEAERDQKFITAVNTVMSLANITAQLSQAGLAAPFNVNTEELAIEVLQRGGIQDVQRFISKIEGNTGQPPGQPGLPANAVGNPNGGITPVAPQLQ